MSRRSLSRLFVAALACPIAALAGPLLPPNGAIMPTYKTLQQVEPRIPIGPEDVPIIIERSGSYYLTDNLYATIAGQVCISINTAGVSIDLMGFEIAPTEIAAWEEGIRGSAAAQNVTIRNGLVRGCADNGVFLFDGSNHHLSDVQARDNGGYGLAAGNNAVIESCAAQGNQGSGIYARDTASVTHCSAFGNGGYGFYIGEGSSVTSCASSLNGGRGFFVSHSSVVADCSASRNQEEGISTNTGTTITGCTARGNTLDGFIFAGSCLVTGNTATDNGSGAGIHATFVDNRIEGNNCTQNLRGIEVGQAGNLIVRNSCSGNATNYDIVANNRYGPVVSIGAGGAPVNGSAAAGNLTTADPWANFSY